MKKIDWSIFFPKQRTLFLFPEEIVAVQTVQILGRCLEKQVFSWPVHGSGQEGLVLAKKTLHMGKDTLCHVGLPLEDMTLVDFTLPLAARDDLDNAVRYALMRHVPFDLDEVRWEYTCQERQGQLHVAVALMQSPVLNKVMERFALAGIPVASVFPACMALASQAGAGGVLALVQGGVQEVVVWNGQRICWRSTSKDDLLQSLRTARAMLDSYGIEGRKLLVLGTLPEPIPTDMELVQLAPDSLNLGGGQHFRIDLVPESTIRSQRRSRISLLAAALVLMLTLAFLPFRDVLVWKQRVAALEQAIAVLRIDAETLVETRQQNTAFEKKMERWARHFAANPDVAQLLREITEVVPEGAWLDSVQIQERKIVLDGSAPSATIVLEQLENSPLFQEMRFDAPVTKQGQLEVFRIAGVISLP